MDNNRAKLVRTSPLVLAAMVATAPAWAQESLSVKELLDRAQTRPQTEAVEDLIRKLQDGTRRPEGTTPEPQRPPLPRAQTAPAAAEKSAPSAVDSPPAAKGVPAPQERQAEPTRAPEAPQVAAPPQLEPSVRPEATAPPGPAPVPWAEISQPPPSVDLEVHFDYKSAEISPQAVGLLTSLGRALSDERLAGQTFLIAGHTDAKGGAAYNLKLSQARAEAVREFLIRYFGVTPDRLIAQGHGYRQLKNSSMPFARENRRVQVTNITRQTARP
jgi:outer membrane protein OmpA-like peptidoglycan-associated protein